jgi:hypothetical protein
MIRHENEGMKFKSPLPAVPVEGFQQQPCVGLDDEKSPALKGREGHEISSRRRDQTGWFHQRWPSAAKAGSLRQPNAVRLEVVPFPFGIFSGQPISGRTSSPARNHVTVLEVSLTTARSGGMTNRATAIEDVDTTGKGTTSSRAAQAPTENSALAAGGHASSLNSGNAEQ